MKYIGNFIAFFYINELLPCFSIFPLTPNKSVKFMYTWENRILNRSFIIIFYVYRLFITIPYRFIIFLIIT
ncbi:hypothetical protein HMPREF9429_00339 [Megasphaera micronuciformis F0359]|uniref:Uncharacterized protein n=1 Tax=Megasphaera micronuciformis F0359 TaxID=706434 RepID=E2ZA79_9FIRM|nr:hypothetical protein HMPREF9429_00339 [Megasphaera micronuciformis F0359]